MYLVRVRVCSIVEITKEIKPSELKYENNCMLTSFFFLFMSHVLLVLFNHCLMKKYMILFELFILKIIVKVTKIEKKEISKEFDVSLMEENDYQI